MLLVTPLGLRPGVLRLLLEEEGAREGWVENGDLEATEGHKREREEEREEEKKQTE